MTESLRYRILNLIKRGGMAEVFQATMRDLDGTETPVAIKRMLPAVGENEWFLRAFVDEARLASQLRHPNIVSVLDYGVMDEHPFQVMEHVDGVDLGELRDLTLSRGQLFDPAHALYVVTEVARALRYAHDAKDQRGRPMKIVHRDVTPHNLLVSWNGEVKLTDFGIALSVGRLEATQSGSVKGKLLYMSPEQMRGDPLDGRTDLFALGCVLHWMLTGRTPLGRENADVDGEVSIDPDLPEDVAAIVRRACAPVLSERYQTADEITGACLASLARRGMASRAKEGFVRWVRGLRPAQAAVDAVEPTVNAFDVEFLPEMSETFRQYRTMHGEVSFLDFGLGGTATGTEPATDEERSTLDADDTLGRTVVPGSEPSLVGLALHGYRVRRLVSDSPAIRIYEAEHVMLDRQSQILEFCLERGMSSRIREAQALVRLKDPGLIQHLDTGLTPQGHQFVVRERAEGLPLADFLERARPIEADRLVELALMIAGSLATLHAVGLQHRRLALSRVLVRDNGSAVLTDLGIGESEEDWPRAELAFLAPELAMGSAPSPAADIYALGGILYWMLAGRLPFSGSGREIRDQQLGPIPPPPPCRGLELLALAMLSPDPAKRPSAVSCVTELSSRARVASAVQSQPSVAPIAGHLRPPPPQNRFLGAMLALSLCVVVLLLFVIFNRADPVEVQIGGERAPGLDPNARPGGTQPLAVVAQAGTSTPSEARRPARQGDARDPRAEEGGTRRSSVPSRASGRSRRRALVALEKKLRAELRSRGLSSADLNALSPVRSSLGTWQAALKSGDPSQAEGALAALLRAMDGAPIEPSLVEAKLERVSKRLASLAGSTSAKDDIDRWETKLLDLRMELPACAKNPEKCRVQLREIARLDREIDEIP